MHRDGLLRVAAAAAAACGVFALLTGNAASAAGAGACSIATAVLAGRRVDRPLPPASRNSPPRQAPDTGPSLESIDLRESDAPSTGDTTQAVETPPDPPTPDETGAAVSTQLLDGNYLAAALRGRVAVARRALRPLSVVHVRIVAEEGDVGSIPARLIAAAAEATLRESDIVGRRDDGIYVVVLEDTGEDGAVWTAERLRRHIAGTIGPQRFQAGVASYPSHGPDAEAVDASAAKALAAAQEWDRDRIEVALH